MVSVFQKMVMEKWLLTLFWHYNQLMHNYMKHDFLVDNKYRNNYPQVNVDFYNLLGAIPMIGENDTPDEYFYKDDAVKLAEWCDDKGVRMTSMWSLNRDKPIAASGEPVDSLFKSTKLSIADYGTGKYEFSKLLKRGNE